MVVRDAVTGGSRGGVSLLRPLRDINYHKLREALEEIFELNHGLLRPEDGAPRRTRRKRD